MGVEDLVADQCHQALDRFLSSSDIVAQKKIVKVSGGAALEDAREIIIVPEGSSGDDHWTIKTKKGWLAEQGASAHSTEGDKLFLGNLDQFLPLLDIDMLHFFQD